MGLVGDGGEAGVRGAGHGGHRDRPGSGRRTAAVLAPSDGGVERGGHGGEQVVHGRLLTGQADDDQGAAGSQVVAEGGERVGERQVVEDGDAGDDVVGAARDSGGCVGDREGHAGRVRGRSQLPRPGDDRRVGVDAVHRGGTGGQQPDQVTAAGTDVQGTAEASGELPQDPRVEVGVVVPGMRGVEPVECCEQAGQQRRHAVSSSDRV